MPKVLNKYKDPSSKNSVSIMRPTKWGNPFVIGPDGNRKEVLEKYKKYIYSNNELMELAEKELKGKDLVCCCAPQLCHGDILLKIANVE